MRIELTMEISQHSGKRRRATKSIELPFLPVAGMYYRDGTWKDTSGMEIKRVKIEIEDEVQEPTIYLSLQADESTDDATLTSCGWQIKS